MYGIVIPKSQGVEYGGKVFISCYSANQIRWTFNDGPLPCNAMEDLNYIRILFASDNHIGHYQCYGTLNNGTKFKEEATVYVGGKYYCN